MPFALGNLQAAKKQLFTTDSKGKITGYQPYTPYSTDANKYVAGFSGMQTQAQQGAANLQMPGQMSAATGIAGASSLGALGAGNQYAQQATDPNSIAAYMSPYMQNVTDYQTQQANRQFDITGASAMGAASRAGAFGGSREALMAAENERNRNQAITGIQATGAQNAFQNAQSAQQFGASLGLQGYQTGIQGAQLLGNLGEQQLGMETGILNTQNQYGAEQQAREQALINQNVKTWENQQNQPYRAMDVMSGLIRGTPINTSSTTATTSVANPSYAQQVGGLLGTAGSLYGAYKGKANGGIVQAYAGGGVTETVENSMEAKLRDMSPEQLRAYLPSITSQEELNIAKMILAEEVPQMATGGIVGYAQGGQLGWREQLELTQQEMKANDYRAHGWTDEDIANYKSSGRVPLDPKKQLETIPGETATSKTIKEPIRSTRVAPEPLPEVTPYESTLEPGKGISTEVKTPWQTESPFTAEELKSGIKSAGKKVLSGVGKVGKGLGIAGAALGLAEAGSETSELDNYLAVRARRGDEDAKKILASGGSDPYLEALKKPVREAIHNMDVGAAWDYLKEKLSSQPSVPEAAKTEQPEEPTGIAAAQKESTPPVASTANLPGSVMEQQANKINLADSAEMTGIKGAAPEDRVYPQEVGRVFDRQGLNANVVSSAYQPSEEPTVQQAPEDDGLSEQRATAAKTPLQIMEEQNAEREKAGIKSPDQISAEQRKEIMAEKSNIGEESKRQMYLRMAEFFSNWGSTPGLPLVAGLKAMKDTIPGVMSDSKEDHAAYKAVNKSLRDLEHATELEKAGHFDKAYAIKEQASATVLKHKEKVAEWSNRRWEIQEEQKGAKERAQIAADTSIEGHKISANAQRAGTNPAALREQHLRTIMSSIDRELGLKSKELATQLGNANLFPNAPNNIPQLKKEISDLTVKLNTLREGGESVQSSATPSGAYKDPRKEALYQNYIPKNKLVGGNNG
jgi:hypothetical protein